MAGRSAGPAGTRCCSSPTTSRRPSTLRPRPGAQLAPGDVADRIEIPLPAGRPRRRCDLGGFAELQGRALRSLAEAAAMSAARGIWPRSPDPRAPARRLGARRALGLDLERAQHRGLPRPGSERHRQVALGGPLAARSERVGHLKEVLLGLRDRGRAPGSRFARPAFTCPSSRGARSIRCWSPRRRSRSSISRRSWSSGSASEWPRSW